MPAGWHAPKWWLKQALCIHRHEGAWNDAGAPYEGGMQFLASTWASVGGRVEYDRWHNPVRWASVALPREQLYRAWRVWLRDGRSWREWGTAGRCHLR